MMETPKLKTMRRQVRNEQLAAMARFEEMTSDLYASKELFTDKQQADPERLIALVAQYFGIPVEDLKTKRGLMLMGRVRRGTLSYDISYIQARAVAYYILYHYTDLSYLEIGKLFLINGEPAKSSGVTIALHKVMDWIDGYDKVYGTAAATLHKYCSLFFTNTVENKRRVRLRHELHMENYYEESHN